MILRRISCLRDLILKPRPDLMTLEGDGGGNLKSWKTLRGEGSGWNLVGKISTSPIYMINIIGTDLLSLGDLKGGLVLKN